MCHILGIRAVRTAHKHMSTISDQKEVLLIEGLEVYDQIKRHRHERITTFLM